MIASKVDLPQPDGPAIETNSPRFTSKSISASACFDFFREKHFA
jgi:hypothetical protein